MLKYWGVEGWSLFIITTSAASIEMFYWYWFWGWVGSSLSNLKSVKDSIEFGKEIGKDLERDGYFDKIRKFFINHAIKKYEWATNPNSWAIRLIKHFGYPGIILLGIEPFMPGGRVVGVIYCRFRKWRSGLIVLTIANIGHIAYMLGGWHLIFKLLGE